MNKWKNHTLAILFTLVSSSQFAMATPQAQLSIDAPVAAEQVNYASKPFNEWLDDFKVEAAGAGISQQTIDTALSNISPLQRVIKEDKNQPERKTFVDYRDKRVNDYRIRKGREMYNLHKDELERIGKIYGVAPQYILALWGMETNYGSYTGNENVIEALATLAWEGRREAFFKRELISALRIIDEGHITVDKMKGSWAGAMGQNQFMPSSFEQYAVDGDGDGQRDIWTNLSDVFASTANYLATHNWESGKRWGREVRLPTGFDPSLSAQYVKDTTVKSLEDWKNLGVTKPNGDPIPVAPGMTAGIIAPDGIAGPAYLVYNNTRVIMRWNNSTYFATSVGLLADQISLAR
jgi:membrane-bound lytic murein transglycosylase B